MHFIYEYLVILRTSPKLCLSCPAECLANGNGISFIVEMKTMQNSNVLKLGACASYAMN